MCVKIAALNVVIIFLKIGCLNFPSHTYFTIKMLISNILALATAHPLNNYGDNETQSLPDCRRHRG